MSRTKFWAWRHLWRNPLSLLPTPDQCRADRTGRVGLEALEDRVMPAGQLWSLPDVLAQVQAGGIHFTGLTVVAGSTGADGDRLLPLGQALRQKADAANGPAQGAWLLDY